MVSSTGASAIGEQADHDLLDRRHHMVLETNAIGDAGDELQLVLIAHLGTDDIVECLDDIR